MIYDIDGNVIISSSGEDLSGLEGLLPNRLLVWHDEFVGPKLDATKWTVGKGRADANDNLIYSSDGEKVTTVNRGLDYYCIKDNPYPNEGFEYSSAFLTTNNLFEFKYGRIEAKIKFPSGINHHSTLWTLGANSEKIADAETSRGTYENGVLFPSCGEIDIAEYDNGTVGFRTHWSTSGFDSGNGYTTGGNANSIISTPNDWHIYACEWTDTTISLYVDGVLKKTWEHQNAEVNGWNPFTHPHYLILNCVVNLTGAVTWDMAETNVAWVRVYAPQGVTELITETGIEIPATANISVGERHWLGTPTFTPSYVTDMTVKWLSHNSDIVTCFGGMLIGKAPGTTYVEAVSKHGCKSLCKVTVTN